MKNTEFEKKAIGVYRSLLEKELARPQIAAEKRAFLAGHFRPQPVWMPGLEALVPAAALAGLFLAFHFLTPQINLRPSLQAPKPISSMLPESKVMAAQKKTPPVKIKKKFFKMPRVWVKKVSSQVGETMIYQKKINHKPVTVVWVFARPGLRAWK